MSTLIQELSSLEPVGPITYSAIIDNLKSLAHRSKRAICIDELLEIACDVELIENECEDLRTHELLKGSSKVIRLRLQDYEEPMMSEFIIVFSARDNIHPLRLMVLVTLNNIASKLVLSGEVINSCQFELAGIVPNQHAYYDLTQEMRLKCPTKCSMYRKMRSLSYTEFCENWSLIKAEVHFRRDSINPIRKLNIVVNDHPQQRWNLTVEELHEDIHYLYNFVYQTRDFAVIQTRWEWGRKFWTLHAKRVSVKGSDEHTIIAKGRAMEMASLQLINDLDLI